MIESAMFCTISPEFRFLVEDPPPAPLAIQQALLVLRVGLSKKTAPSGPMSPAYTAPEAARTAESITEAGVAAFGWCHPVADGRHKTLHPDRYWDHCSADRFDYVLACESPPLWLLISFS